MSEIRTVEGEMCKVEVCQVNLPYVNSIQREIEGMFVAIHAPEPRQSSHGFGE